MLKIKQAAEKAGVSPTLVYAWCMESRLAHFRVGRQGSRGSIRIAEADLDAFLATLRCEKSPEPIAPAPKAAKKPPIILKHLRLPQPS